MLFVYVLLNYIKNQDFMAVNLSLIILSLFIHNCFYVGNLFESITKSKAGYNLNSLLIKN